MPRAHQEQSVLWPQEMQDDPMDGVGEDDFSKFLDLDSDFNFAGLDHGQSAIDTPMGRLAFGQSAGPQPGTQPVDFNGQPMSLDMSAGGPSGFEDPMHNAQQFEHFQQQYQPMQMHHSYQVPPTPVSAEMQAAKYGTHVDATGQLMFERQQVSFTPLVSPAQTPLTHAYTMPQFGIAEDFFSPLTSPAIEAQNPYSSARTTASPVDLNVDVSSKSTSAPRTRKRRGSGTTRTGGRSVKQSPVVKPKGSRRKQSLTGLSTDKVTELLNQANNRDKSGHNRQGSSIPAHVLASAARSSDDSVSPEPLSESLMRPPPLPTAEKSPRGFGLSQQDSGNGVTPLALMSFPGKTPGSGKGVEPAASIPEDDLEDMMLPDAAAPVPANVIEQPTYRPRSDEQATPRLSTGPSAKGSSSTGPRPMLPKTPIDEAASKTPKMDGRSNTSRSSKKRGTTTSATISPAIRPKISPSISPLVPTSGGPSRPGTAMPHLSAETSALYLASKSNYQNIIDGTHLPGVSYPEALAENLSSKRTSHKIAEQGRRNRINLALKEIETLLPPSISSPTTKKEVTLESETPGKGSSASSGASKASTVEMAIVYIKSLQAELADTKDKLNAAEKKLAADTNSSAGSQTSD